MADFRRRKANGPTARKVARAGVRLASGYARKRPAPLGFYLAVAATSGTAQGACGKRSPSCVLWRQFTGGPLATREPWFKGV